jgi:hypothetical protein
MLASLRGLYALFSNQSPLKPLSQSVGSLLRQYDTQEAEGIMSDIQAEFNQTVKDNFTLAEPEGDTTPKPGAGRQDGVEKVRKTNLKVVVMIDELDRCPLEKIVDILEAVKLFLAEEIFIVLMAVDTRVIAEAVRLHYKDVKNPNLAREYLEKIIQIPVQVPEADLQQLTGFVDGLMNVEADETGPEPEPVVVAGIESGRLVTLPPAERAPLAASEDLFNPLQLADTALERQALVNFGIEYLDSNPRRIKRLLNTYRFVKILATRRGERTDQPDWQEKMINWLGFTMRWPTFMARILQQEPLPASVDDYLARAEAWGGELLPGQRPPEAAFQLKLPAGMELARFELLADNFIVESPPEVVAPPAIEAEPQTGAQSKAAPESEADA